LGIAEVKSGAVAILRSLLPSGQDQVVAYARLLLSSVALVAIYIDPTQPTRFTQATYTILSLYVVWSIVLVLRAWRGRADVLPYLFVHVLDIAVFTALVYLTEGPTSPFFVFFTFSIVSAGLHWGARGAVTTAAVVLAAFLISAIASLGLQTTDTNRTLVRAAYLLVAALLIGFFGWHRERIGQQLQRLSEWPAVSTPLTDDPPIELSLRHAALVLGVKRIDMVWRDRRTGLWHLAELSEDRFKVSTWAEPQPPLEKSAAEDDGQTGELAPTASLLTKVGATALVSAFVGAHAEGVVLVVDPPTAGQADLRRSIEIVSRRMGLELEHHYLRVELADTAISRERQRLSRDMHDGILQDLTAVSLHLEAISRSVPEERRGAIGDLSNLIRAQQARIRSFVSEMNPGMRRAKLVELLPRLERTALSLSRQWNIDVKSVVLPPDARIAETDEVHLHSLVGEATANSVRHGAATSVRLNVTVGDAITLEVVDNGRAPKPVTGDLSVLPSPISLKERVADLGGTYSATLSEAGVSIRVSLPVRA
jgi:signal transduction histidine kinase